MSYFTISIFQMGMLLTRGCARVIGRGDEKADRDEVILIDSKASKDDDLRRRKATSR